MSYTCAIPIKYHAPHRHKFQPLKHRVSNWRDYNQSLEQRADITIWFEEKAISKWYTRRSHKPGAQRVYSNPAIAFFAVRNV